MSLTARLRGLLGATPASAPPPPDPDHLLAATAFDAAFYLKANADVAAAGVDPLAHFMAFGWKEGRDPSPDFSLRAYAAAFPEAQDVNPLVHWLQAGRPPIRSREPALGFRLEVIEGLHPLEARIAAATAALPPAAPREALAALSADGLEAVHITFSHDDFTANVGGLQLAIQREAARLAALGRGHLHLYPARPWPVVRAPGEAERLGVVWNGANLGFHEPAAVAETLAGAGPAAGRSFAIHSLLGHEAGEVADILAAAGLRAGAFWLHDFASVCAGFHLMRDDVADCGGPPPGSPACGICIYGPWRARHRDAHARLFRRLSLTVAAPSQSALDTWRATSGLTAAAYSVWPHATLVPRGPAPVVDPARPFRLAFAGVPATHKGWPLFRALANQGADDPRYQFLHLGVRRDPGTDARFIEVAVSPDNPLAMRDALAAAEVDAVLAWSLCRETFSFVAYEAVAAGAAVITGPDSGNIAAFVAQGGHGRVLETEADLPALFETGAVLDLARARRRPMLYDLAFSALTLDLPALAAAGDPPAA